MANDVGLCNLLLPTMLPYLAVKDLLACRLLCQQNSSPKALLAHMAGLGSIEWSGSAAFCYMGDRPTITFRCDAEKKASVGGGA